MKPYQRDRVWWARIPRAGLHAQPRSLGVSDQTVAKSICTFLAFLRDKGEGYLLHEIAEGRVMPLPAYHAWRDDKLTQFIAQTKHRRDDVLLAAHLDGWQTELARLKTPNEAGRVRYLRQVKTLITPDFRASQLTKDAIRKWLASSGNTPNRFHAALSSFCAYLVDNDVMARNVARDVKRASEAKPRDVHLTPEELALVLAAMPDDYRAYVTLAVVCAMERSAMLNLLRRDIDLDAKTVMAKGTKSDHRHARTRRRTCFVYWRWEKEWNWFANWLRKQPLLPNSQVFTNPYDAYYHQLIAACKSVQVSVIRPHDLRRCWGVQAAKDGLPIQVIQRQEGHARASITYDVYSSWTPTQADFAVPNHTNNHTVQQEAVR